MRQKVAASFSSEKELCAAFITWAGLSHPDWTAYAETAGWDILLAHLDGTQIGIQAKLKFNIAVLEQAVESPWSHEVGPDYRAILVPQGNSNLCAALGLTLIHSKKLWGDKISFAPDLTGRVLDKWHYCNPKKRHVLPAYIPDVPAGVPSPTSLTKWKIGALEISALIEIRGFVIREDFRVAGIDHRRWTNYWLEAVPDNPGAYRWRNGADQGFSSQHPEVYPKIRQKIEKRLGG